MSQILLLGYNPPPYQAHSKLEAANYRTWQFVQPLLAEGHTVCLCVSDLSKRSAPHAAPKNLVWRALPFDTLGWPRKLQALHDDFRPDCVVAIDFYPALYATRLKTSQPIWMDLYGDPLTIVQVARYRTGTNQGIGTAIALMRQILTRGDVFSVCGIPQQHMLVGELAMAGRLNSQTFGYDFVHAVYPGAPPILTDPDPIEMRQIIGIDPDAFVVLWCGGYNTWTDVTTLFRALEQAMETNSRVHFVSVGASTYTAAETQYDRLVKLAAQSSFTGRFHLLGWRPWKDIPGFYQGSDVGINIDAMHYETIYGTRTRLMEMLAHNLPVLTTEGSELSHILRDHRVGISFPAGDCNSLAQHILRLTNVPAELEEMRSLAKRLVVEDLSFHATTAVLRQWVAAPKPAPDRAAARARQYLQNTKFRMRTLARLFLWQLGLSGRQP